jgi:hypothetical protein
MLYISLVYLDPFCIIMEQLRELISYVICIGISLTAVDCASQNIVPNPGFEDYLELPCALNKKTIQNLLVDWLQPLATTTDYYNSHAAVGCDLNPLTYNLSIRTGNGMVGVITAAYTNGAPREYQEYIEVKLEQKIRKGASYHLQFYAP